MQIKISGRILLGLALLSAVAACPEVPAQETSSSGLHQRDTTNPASSDEPENESGTDQVSTLPGDVSGAYHFTHFNDSIEIDIEGNKLSGYISQLGDSDTDKNTALTFFFSKTSIDGSQIAFETRVLHGIWYSFRGTIFRGEAKTREEDGYYVLHGILQEHHPQASDGKSADETIERRVVSFKSMGR